MQSENFDKKIKDSLSQRPPGNDNPEWEKMEALLDKHMPVEKKDRRRIIFILFTFLLLGGGTFLIWQNNNRNKSNITEIKSQKQNTGTKENNNPENRSIEKEHSSSPLPGNAGDQSAPSQKNIDPKISENHDALLPESQKISYTLEERNDKKRTNNNSTIAKADEGKKVTETPVKDFNADKRSVVIKDLTKTETAPLITGQEQAKESEPQKEATDHKVAEPKEETKETNPGVTKKADTRDQKNKNSFGSNFFFTLSAGPDFSAVGGNTGEIRLAYGAGLGYQISKKFSVRAGFYVAKKVYTADPGDYHPPTNFWTYYPNLENIDADCKVYDIPVTVDYKISNNKKESWFVSAGVSSLLMKEEKYDYYFKPNYSPTYVTYTRTFTNQNQHYFSILNLSGGYTRVLNKKVSLQAEPYFKIAMTGIGYGRVKLNSSGVLFSAIIKPFAKK